MPQLDKYIFFNQIIYLTIFFWLIYIYIRGIFIPKISALLKYRKKKINLLNIQIENYIKILNFAKSFFDKKGKNYILFLIDHVYNINLLYIRNANLQFHVLYNKYFNHIITQYNFFYFLFKYKIEFKRLDNINN